MTGQLLKQEKKDSDPHNWVDEHGDYLFRYAMSRLNNRSLAEDMVQDTFLSALKAYEKFDGKSSERTWFTSILKHKIIDHFRKLSRRQESSLDKTETDDPADDFRQQGFMKGAWITQKAPADWGDHPENAFEQNEFMDVFQYCLTRLPEWIAGVFSMRELEELESDEICKELGITPSNLWVMLHRARSLLRRCIEHNWFLAGKNGVRKP